MNQFLKEVPTEQNIYFVIYFPLSIKYLSKDGVITLKDVHASRQNEKVYIVGFLLLKNVTHAIPYSLTFSKYVFGVRVLTVKAWNMINCISIKLPWTHFRLTFRFGCEYDFGGNNSPVSRAVDLSITIIQTNYPDYRSKHYTIYWSQRTSQKEIC